MKKCPICGTKLGKPYKTSVTSVYSDHPYDIAHCTNCDHYCTSPAPTKAELDHIYGDKYSYDAHALIEGEKTMRAAKYAKYIAGINGAKKALEVGCMHGLLLTQLQKHGLKVSGVELDPEAVKYCRAQGLNVVQSSIEDHLSHTKSAHDVIIMSHVIEHIADPTKQLTELHKRMAKDGRLVLITPNSNASTRKLFGKYWGYWQVPVHINHFNRNSMSQLLENTGFEVQKVQYFGGDSLFFLSSLANLTHSGNETKQLSKSKQWVVKIATVLLRPWYFLGTEDMLVVAKPSKH